ncbi:hypothetical protein HY631_04350 [Candidatus Uhrbacteria bacterium]|nr:hypothetical protein [Candidatus Uhrbacteria bacterium]
MILHDPGDRPPPEVPLPTSPSTPLSDLIAIRDAISDLLAHDPDATDPRVEELPASEVLRQLDALDHWLTGLDRYLVRLRARVMNRDQVAEAAPGERAARPLASARPVDESWPGTPGFDESASPVPADPGPPRSKKDARSS